MHDELVLEAAEDRAEEAVTVPRTDEQALWLDVPTLMEIRWARWADLN